LAGLCGKGAGITVAASSPLNNTALAAPRLAQGLFAGFPGNSGGNHTGEVMNPIQIDTDFDSGNMKCWA
jgi:hypothetical protein